MGALICMRTWGIRGSAVSMRFGDNDEREGVPDERSGVVQIAAEAMVRSLRVLPFLYTVYTRVGLTEEAE